MTGGVAGVVYSRAAHNDVSVNDEPHIRRWFHKILIYYIILYCIILYCIVLYYIILYYITTVLQLPTVFSTVTCCTGL